MGYGTETFFLGNAVKVGWAVTQRREPPAAAHFTSPFSRPKLEPWGWVMTGIEGHSIAKALVANARSGPGFPLLGYANLRLAQLAPNRAASFPPTSWSHPACFPASSPSPPPGEPFCL